MYDHRYGYIEDPSGGGLSGLGAADCSTFLKLYQIYTRLSKKKDKKKATRAHAAQLAAANLQKYNQCKAPKPKPRAIPHAPTPVAPPPTSHPDPGPSVPVQPPISIPVEPIPYTPMPGGGGGPVYEALPPIQPIPQQPMPMPVQVPVGPPKTEVPYVQMPEMPTPQQFIPPEVVPATPTVLMPGSAAAAAAPGISQEINEADLAGKGPVEYWDMWGPIKVIELVIPKKKAGPTSRSVEGGATLPGGTMDIDMFTSEYTLQGEPL